MLGCEQFLHNDRWDIDLIAQDHDCIIGKLDFSAYEALKEAQPAAAAKIYNRIIRHKTFELIYQRKNDIEYYHEHLERQMDGMGLKDTDLMIDMRLGTSKDIQNVYKANAANEVEISAGEMKKKREHAEKELEQRRRLGGSRAAQSSGEAYADYVLGTAGQLMGGPPGDLRKARAGPGARPKSSLAAPAQRDRHQSTDFGAAPTSKAYRLDCVPLFLAAEYRDIYARSKKRAESSLAEVGKASAAEARAAKGAAKTYKQKWIQEKLTAQLETKKKKRDGGKEKEQEKAAAEG